MKENQKQDYQLLSINSDNCPDNDAIIYPNMCDGNCKHYKGFELYHSQRCIKCSYYQDVEVTQQH